MRQQRKDRGKRSIPVGLSILVVVVLLLAGSAAVWFLFLRGEGAGPGVSEFSFRVIKVSDATVASDVPEQVLRRGARRVHEAMDALYVAGFVDPDQWDDGQFPEVLERFDEVARDRAQRDLDVLALGGEAPQIESVKPLNGKLRIRFLVANQRLAAAVAVAAFRAEAEYEDDRRVLVEQEGTYYLRHAGEGQWLIIAYDVHRQLTRESRQPDQGAGSNQ